jgi:hypothetical protein
MLVLVLLLLLLLPGERVATVVCGWQHAVAVNSEKRRASEFVRVVAKETAGMRKRDSRVQGVAQEVWKLSWTPCPARPDSPQVSRKSRGMISDRPKSQCCGIRKGVR